MAYKFLTSGLNVFLFLISCFTFLKRTSYQNLKCITWLQLSVFLSWPDSVHLHFLQISWRKGNWYKLLRRQSSFFSNQIISVLAKGKAVDASQELFALGFSNIMSSFVRSFPLAGSFSRTAVNNGSGVKTPLGGLMTGK